MIEYDKNECFGLKMFVSLLGSVIPRAIPWAVVSGVISYLLRTGSRLGFDNRPIDELFGHPYAHQVFAVSFGYLLVLRTNLAYQRYWEGITNVQLMISKWYDATAQCIAFDELSIKPAADTGLLFREHVVHLVSLISALAFSTLQRFDDLDRLTEQDFTKARESTTSLGYGKDHKARKQSMIVAMFPTLEAVYKEDITRHPLPVLAGLSPEERNAIEPHGDRVGVVVSSLLRDITWRHRDGGLNVPPPILSRVYQEVSNGMLGFNHALKIVSVPFPFPYAQLIAYLKIAFVFTCPLVAASFTESSAMSAILSFLTVLSFTALNEVAGELEDPFGKDANDLPLEQIHRNFNAMLESLLIDRSNSSKPFPTFETRVPVAAKPEVADNVFAAKALAAEVKDNAAQRKEAQQKEAQAAATNALKGNNPSALMA